MRKNPRPIDFHDSVPAKVHSYMKECVVEMFNKIQTIRFLDYNHDFSSELFISLPYNHPSVRAQLFPQSLVVSKKIGENEIRITNSQGHIILACGTNYSLQTLSNILPALGKRIGHPDPQLLLNWLSEIYKAIVSEVTFVAFSHIFARPLPGKPPLEIRSTLGRETLVYASFLPGDENTMAATTPMGRGEMILSLVFPQDFTVLDVVESVQAMSEKQQEMVFFILAHEVGHALDPGTRITRYFHPDTESRKKHGVGIEELHGVDREAYWDIMSDYFGDPSEVKAETAAILWKIRLSLLEERTRPGSKATPPHPRELPRLIQKACDEMDVENRFVKMKPKAQNKMLRYLTTALLEEGLLAALA